MGSLTSPFFVVMQTVHVRPLPGVTSVNAVTHFLWSVSLRHGHFGLCHIVLSVGISLCTFYLVASFWGILFTIKSHCCNSTFTDWRFHYFAGSKEHLSTRKPSLEVGLTNLATFLVCYLFTVSSSGLLFSYGAVTGFSNFKFTFRAVKCIHSRKRNIFFL